MRLSCLPGGSFVRVARPGEQTFEELLPSAR